MDDKWKVLKSEDCWFEVEDPNGWYEATVKWDGCIDLVKLHNVPLPVTEEHPQIVDCFHICSIDEEIERLQELKRLALKHFGNDWG